MDSKDVIDYYVLKHSMDDGFCKGSALHKHIPYIAILVQEYDLNSILDYGCGKAQFWKENPHWRAMFEWTGTHREHALWLYDPGINETPAQEKRAWLAIHNTLPLGRYDLVVCTDVLEHVPEGDIPYTLDTILSKSRKFVYLNVSCYPATKTFPDGTNIHVTIKSRTWWKDQIKESQDRIFLKSKAHLNLIVKFDEER